MSLINQMLKDLDKKRQEDGTDDGGSAAADATEAPQKKTMSLADLEEKAAAIEAESSEQAAPTTSRVSDEASEQSSTPDTADSGGGVDVRGPERATRQKAVELTNDSDIDSVDVSSTEEVGAKVSIDAVSETSTVADDDHDIDAVDVDEGEGGSSKRRLLWILIAVLVVLAVWWFWPAASKARVPVKPVKPVAEIKPLKPVIPELKGAAVIQTEETAAVTLSLGSRVDYEVHSTPTGVTLQLHGTVPAKAFKLPAIKSSEDLIRSVSMDANKTEIKLNFTVAEGTQVASLHYETSGSDQLVLKLSNQRLKAANAAKRAEAALTPEQRAARSYREAVQMIVAGNAPGAQERLREVLRAVPSYHVARVALINSLLSMKQDTEAREEVLKGLTIAPRNIGYVQADARLKFMEGHTKSALKLLMSQSPSIELYPGYYALIAAIETRLHHYENAAMYYEQLLTHEPKNAVWWMGLGISYTKLNQPNLAMNAFHKAITAGGLTPATKLYVMQQIKMLSQ